jgi:cell division septation protein DedD
MQQRAATQEELRQLRATLATSANTQAMSAGREALQNMQQSYDKLSANAEALTLENRRLADTVAGLQAQLGVQQAVLTKAVPAAKPVESATAREAASLQRVAPKPVATRPATPQPMPSKPAAAQSAAEAPSGPWFVNFASYSSRSTAETWAKKLSPGAGRVVIVPSAKGGQTLYRVRVVGLASRGSAQEVARKLEAELRVAALWVGQE